jgi:hypothetical protein
MIIMKLLIIAVLLVYTGLQLMLMLRKSNMHRNEKKLKLAGVNPYGSSLCHGMVLKRDDKKSVTRDSKPSPVWYNRLL